MSLRMKLPPDFDKPEVTIWDKEYDQAFLDRFADFLESGFHAEYKGHYWGLWGAQEVSQWTLSIGDEEIVIMAETYMGLTLLGPKKLVNI